jgi:hypothetical protein
VFLGVIAVAVAIMAIVQIGVIVAGLRVVRRIEQLATELDAGIKPLIANLTALSAEASKAASLASAQVERFDKLVSELGGRLEHTMATAQQFVAGPARQGLAIVAGIRAAMAAFHGLRESARRRTVVRPRSHEEEEESLFIG